MAATYLFVRIYICMYIEWLLLLLLFAAHLLFMPVSHLFLLQTYFCLCVALLARNVRLAHAFEAFAASCYSHFHLVVVVIAVVGVTRHC